MLIYILCACLCLQLFWVNKCQLTIVLEGPFNKVVSIAASKFKWVIIKNVCLLCATRDFRGYFVHLGTSIVISLLRYSYLLT